MNTNIRRKRSSSNQTCDVELDQDYPGGQVTHYQLSGTSNSWIACKQFCYSNTAKYFTWIGTDGSNQEYSCWCRNVQSGGLSVSGRVSGDTSGCSNAATAHSYCEGLGLGLAMWDTAQSYEDIKYLATVSLQSDLWTALTNEDDKNCNDKDSCDNKLLWRQTQGGPGEYFQANSAYNRYGLGVLKLSNN